MSRLIIELRCQRIPKEHVYDGSIVMYEEGNQGNCLGFPFKRSDLQDVAEELHHAVRLASRRREEFCVRMLQSAPNSKRPAVPIELRPEQAQKIYESIESARIFFSPMFRERKINEGENLQEAIEQEIENATENQ